MKTIAPTKLIKLNNLQQEYSRLNKLYEHVKQAEDVIEYDELKLKKIDIKDLTSVYELLLLAGEKISAEISKKQTEAIKIYN